MSHTYRIVEQLADDTERTIATCAELDDAERLIGALRAVRNELPTNLKGDYGIASLDGDVDWEIQ
jgi:hypothetical protein